jgi:hypothetical protein
MALRCSECQLLVAGAYDDSHEPSDFSSIHEVNIEGDPFGRRYVCSLCVCRLDMSEYFIEHPRLTYTIRVEQQTIETLARLWPPDIVTVCPSLTELSKYLSEFELTSTETTTAIPYFHVTVSDRLSPPPQLCIAGFHDDCQSSLLQQVQHWYRVLHQNRVYYYHPKPSLQSIFYERSVQQANLQLTRIMTNPASSVPFDFAVLDAFFQLPCFNLSVEHHVWKPLLLIICSYIRLDSSHLIVSHPLCADNKADGSYNSFRLSQSTQYVLADYQRNRLNPVWNLKRNLKRYHQLIREQKQYEQQTPQPEDENDDDQPLAQPKHKKPCVRVNNPSINL